MTNKDWNSCPICTVGSVEVVYHGLPFNMGGGKDKVLKCRKCGKLFLNLRCEQASCESDPPYLRLHRIESTLTDVKLSCPNCDHPYSAKTLVGNLAIVAPIVIGIAAAVTLLKQMGEYIDLDIFSG